MKDLDATDLQACSVLTQAAGTLKTVRMTQQIERPAAPCLHHDAAPCLHHHAVLQETHMHVCIHI